ncbi:MAG: hypothetical protein BroJett040_05110 [Oligoflexia bacterium]|nr:MAG: hypothetical protein BroJett040_05110 [Oligoflexia bacterium]
MKHSSKKMESPKKPEMKGAQSAQTSERKDKPSQSARPQKVEEQAWKPKPSRPAL